MNADHGKLKIGTCSWKYDSWIGLIYTEAAKKNYLKEYSKQYNTVEIDQWFWSLFPGSEIKLPDIKVVEQYNSKGLKKRLKSDGIRLLNQRMMS